MTNWVFIRGLARRASHWNGFPELVRERLGGEVFCLDLPGVGEKAKGPVPLKIRGYSAILHHELRALRQGRDPAIPWTLVAVSLGGMVGLDWASRFPGDFQNLVTINTSAGSLSPLVRRLRPEAIRTILRLFLKNDVPERERAILKLTTNLIEVDDALVSRWVSYDQDSPLTRGTFLRQILAATGFRPPASLPVRSLVLASEKDRLVHPGCSRDLARHLGTDLLLHPEAGHDLTLDDPEWAIRELEKFISPGR